MAVALYARVSTAKQAEKDLSIPDQLKQMRHWCKAHGYLVAVEYVEPGASGTDDKRPVFQRMVAEATQEPPPFEAIIVHSRSRFFRDLFEFLSYERALKRCEVKVLSITQQTSDDPAGEMASKIFSLFDEYQSKENAKHTLRAMNENARQGYFNGSRPTFGYRAVETEARGNKGKKRRLEVDPVEAGIVKQLYGLYLDGHEGRDMGCKAIACYLNERSLRMRRLPWSRGRVHEVLSNRTYLGEFSFNRRGKDGRLKPESEWVKVAVPPIIDAGTFGRAHARLRARAPAEVPPRLVNTPTLLTGLLKCGGCGAGMTLMTGKGGRYRYYKCHTRIGQGNHYCDAPTVPMQKLDTLVLNALAEKAFTPQRVKGMLAQLREHLGSARGEEENQLNALTGELKDIERGTERLYEAVEKELLPMDSTLQERAHKLKVRRETILRELAGLRRAKELPASLLNLNRIDAFCRALKARLLDPNKGFAKQYLRLLVSEIRLTGKEVRLQGSHAALAHAMSATGTLTGGVPSFVPGWLPDQGSNLGPADYNACALDYLITLGMAR